MLRLAEAVVDGFMPEVRDMIMESATAAFRTLSSRTMT